MPLRFNYSKRFAALKRNHTKLHRTLKWSWVGLLPVSFFWRDSVIWVVIMSHYAILVSHWSAEEAAEGE